MKKLMKKSTAAVLALIRVLSAAACGVASSPTQQAESAVKGMIDAFKAADFETASKYLNTDEVFDSAELDELPDGGIDLFKTVFDKLQYEIVSSEQVTDEQVQVTTKITAVDMKPVLEQFMGKMLEYAFANAFADPAPTDEEMEEKMLEIFGELLATEDLAMVTNEVVIPVTKTEAGWRVEADDLFTDALLGGMLTAVEEMESAFE